MLNQHVFLKLVFIHLQSVLISAVEILNGIITNFQRESKELDDWVSCKDDYMCNPSTCECVLIRSVKLMNIQIFKVIYSKIVSLNYVKINSVNPLYLIIYNINVYLEENRGNKHLKVVPTNESKGAPKNVKNYVTKLKTLLDQ